MKFRHRQVEELEEGESYYVSMTDMMVGVVFIFIIMLSYFALQYRQTTVSLTRPQSRSQAAQATPSASVAEPQMVFATDEIFAPGTDDLTDKGQQTAASLAATLMSRLACNDPRTRTPDCNAVPRVNAVVIIVRTFVDSTTDEGRSALVLSQQRAHALYEAVVAEKPALADMREPSGSPVVQATSGTMEVRGHKSSSRVTIRFYGATTPAQ